MHTCKIFLLSLIDRILIHLKKINEKKKFKHPNRVAIYSQVTLSKQDFSDIDDLYKSNYGHKIPYLWHRYYTAYTGHFDKNYFPELLYIPEFEHFMNIDSDYIKVYQNKNILPYIANAAGIKMPHTILSCSAGIYKDTFGNILTKSEAIGFLMHYTGDVFIKPAVDSCSGNGCQCLSFPGHLSYKEFSKILENLGNDFIVQNRLLTHSSISKIYPNSVNTFRIITYRWNNSIKVMPSIMRIGQGGSYLDNAHAGGMFIGIDVLGNLHDSAYTEFKDNFKSHPDTGVIFKNYCIPGFPRVLSAAKRMHSFMPQIGCVNWDFTLDENEEPVLIDLSFSIFCTQYYS